MDWLFSNPIADMSGPVFLVVYAVFATAIVIASRMQIAGADGSAAGPPPAVAVDRDPYEVAYLRGGGNELLRFSVFDLVRQGYLTYSDPATASIKNPATVSATPKAGAESLPAFHQHILAFYATPQTTPQLFASQLPAEAATYGAATYKTRLQNERFYTSDDVRAAAARARMFGALGLILFSGYRILNAVFREHHNIAFLIIETVFALVALLLATRVPLLSRRGRSFLERLATALKPMPMAPAAAGIGMLPILVAATGLGALAGTEFGPMKTLFPRAAGIGGTGSSCSGGCGSSSGGDGGSSGGDGGGGCGGGGCGG